MHREEFGQYVARIEERFADRPMALRARTAAIIAIGYLGFLLWLVLLLVAGSMLFYGSLHLDSGGGLVLMGVGAVLLAAATVQGLQLLWVNAPERKCRRLRSSEAPRLFQLLKRLRATSRSARVHAVFLTPDFNAAVRQAPRLGVFGWSRNLLYLGLPLMEALAPAEFEAVMAHEMAHLSRKHGRFTTWVYRLHSTWEQLFDALHQAAAESTAIRWLQAGLVRFVDWYWPRFHAYTFVLSRANEYDADRFAAETAGAENTAMALWRIECLFLRLHDKILPHLWQAANESAEPLAEPVRRMVEELSEPPATGDAARWMERARTALTDHMDTHPSLADRVGALALDLQQWAPRQFPVVASPSAAETLLPGSLPALRGEVDALWRKENEQLWQQRHKRVAALQQRLDTLGEDASGSPGDEDADRLWEQAQALYDMQGLDAAEALLRRVVGAKPTHSAANLLLGQSLLLERSETEGALFLERILQREDDELIPFACQALAGFYQSTGQADQLRQVHQRLGRFEAARVAGDRELSVVTASDTFLPADLAEPELRDFINGLQQQRDLSSAYLVRKALEHFPERRLYVLCVRGKLGLFGRSRSRDDAALVARLIPRIELPGRVLVIAPRGGFRPLARKIMRLPGAQIV